MSTDETRLESERALIRNAGGGLLLYCTPKVCGGDRLRSQIWERKTPVQRQFGIEPSVSLHLFKSAILGAMSQ
jgi:hypothetical protein